MEVTIRDVFDERAACDLYGLDRDRLLERMTDAAHLGHWFAYRPDGTPVGLAAATAHVDDRVFVTHRVQDERAFLPLLVRALRALDGRLYVTIGSEFPERLVAARWLGLRDDLVGQRFEVPFAEALSRLPHPKPSDGCRIVTADHVDPDALSNSTPRCAQRRAGE